MCQRMLADIHPDQIKLTKRTRTLDRKVHTSCYIGKAKAELVQHGWCDRVGVRKQETPIVHGIHVVWEERVRRVFRDILAAEAGIGGLLRRDGLVEANIRAIG